MSGFPGDLSEEQETALAQLRGELSAGNHAAASWDDVTMCRFLRARQFNVENTTTMINNYITWRSEYRPDLIVYEGVVREELERNKLVVMGKDKKGQPSFIFYCGQHNPSQSDLNVVLQTYIYVFENLIRRLPADVHYMNMIYDFQNWGLKNVDVAMFKQLISTMQDYYPERLAMSYVVNPPWLFKGVWAAIKIFLDAKTLKKVKFIGKNIQEEMLVDYEPDQLATLYGGQKELPAEFDIKSLVGEDFDPLNPAASHAAAAAAAAPAPDPQPAPVVAGPAPTLERAERAQAAPAASSRHRAHRPSRTRSRSRSDSGSKSYSDEEREAEPEEGQRRGRLNSGADSARSVYFDPEPLTFRAPITDEFVDEDTRRRQRKAEREAARMVKAQQLAKLKADNAKAEAEAAALEKEAEDVQKQLRDVQSRNLQIERDVAAARRQAGPKK